MGTHAPPPPQSCDRGAEQLTKTKQITEGWANASLL